MTPFYGRYTAAASVLLLAGLGMQLLLTSGSATTNTARAALLVGLVATADVLGQIAIPIFWAFHNSTQQR